MFRFFSSCNKYSSFLRDIVSIWDMAMGFYDIRSLENTYSIRSIILSYKNRNFCWRVVIGELLFIKTLITPAVVSKWCTLLKIQFWNNFAGLNMCCALLNAAHFKGPGVDCLLTLISIKMENPLATPSEPHCVYHIWCTQGPGWLGLTKLNVVLL